MNINVKWKEEEPTYASALVRHSVGCYVRAEDHLNGDKMWGIIHPYYSGNDKKYYVIMVTNSESPLKKVGGVYHMNGDTLVSVISRRVTADYTLEK